MTVKVHGRVGILTRQFASPSESCDNMGRIAGFTLTDALKPLVDILLSVSFCFMSFSQFYDITCP